MDSRIIHLFRKYLNDHCTPRELEEVFSLLKSGTHQSEWEAAISEDAEQIFRSEKQSNITDQEAELIYNKIESKLPAADGGKIVPLTKRSVRLWQTVSAAAAIIIMVTAGLLYFNQKDLQEQSGPVYSGKIAPGSDKAFLTLSNGKKISLTDATKGNIARQSGISITKTSDGQIIYTVEHADKKAGPAQFNTIETPKGGQFQVRLPDGTAVWLNAASTLTYPVSFDESDVRSVQLVGEAYFEVAKDKVRPFIVKTDRQKVEVLGTHFNINGYKDEPVISTTLLEGSVKVMDASSGQSQLLSPGLQANVSKGRNLITVSKVNTANIISWKNGYFIFDNQDITSVMKVISRWYDVNVEYKSINGDERFGGTFSRSSNLSDILKVLEKLGNVQFEIEGKRIIVSK